jgi:RNA polymerase sigma factor for flagellar operon FliA
MTLALERPMNPDISSGHRASHVEDLVRQHLPLVGHLVREVKNRIPAHVHRDELVSAAMFALATSARGFDPTLGVPFARFASIRIRGALTDELRSMDWASRAVRGKAREVDATRHDLIQNLGRTPSDGETARTMGISTTELAAIESDVYRAATVSLHAISPDSGAEVLPAHTEGPETLLLRREQLGYLRDAVAELPERLNIVVEQYFFQQRKMTDIATDLGVTESRVSQLRSEALALLREGMRAADDTALPLTAAGTGRNAARRMYGAAVATRSTLAGRLAATTLLGERRPEPGQSPQRIAH